MENRNYDNLKLINNIIAFGISISIILFQYQAPISNLGIIILLFCSAVSLVVYRHIEIYKPLFFVFLAFALQQTVAWKFNNIETYILIGFFESLLIILLIISSICWNQNIKEPFYRYYTVIGIICCFIVIIQMLYSLFTGNNVKPIYLFPNQVNVDNWSNASQRASGLFPEPQVFSSYMLPLLIILLKKRKIFLSLFVSTSILFSGSSLGILLISAIWIYYFIKEKDDKMRKLILIYIFVAFIVFFFSNDSFDFMRSKLISFFKDYKKYSNVVMSSSYSYSNYQRVLKGWDTLRQMPLIDKIIGTGYGGQSFKNYLIRSRINFNWMKIWNISSPGALYYSSAAGVFIECGIFCSVFYYIFLIKKVILSDKLGRAIILSFILMGFTTQTFLNGIFVFYILLYYLLSNTREG